MCLAQARFSLRASWIFVPSNCSPALPSLFEISAAKLCLTMNNHVFCFFFLASLRSPSCGLLFFFLQFFFPLLSLLRKLFCFELYFTPQTQAPVRRPQYNIWDLSITCPSVKLMRMPFLISIVQSRIFCRGPLPSGMNLPFRSELESPDLSRKGRPFPAFHAVLSSVLGSFNFYWVLAHPPV